ncbi:MAG: GerMN domain-containing protein [Proteobacteria bacterium]|nr:GerMN domain-containing protein [Pseudomonadota bacterium]
MGRKRLIFFSVLTLIAAGAACLLLAYFYGKQPFSAFFRWGESGIRQTFSGKSVISLYFADTDNAFLKSEQRSIPRTSDPAELGRVIIESLIKGPGGGLVRTIPEEASLKAFYITKDGSAYADFTAAIRDKHPGGSSSELLTVYSVVNSLVMNIPKIKRVKILIEGRESMTLAGHMDLRFPFKANLLVVR